MAGSQDRRGGAGGRKKKVIMTMGGRVLRSPRRIAQAGKVNPPISLLDTQEIFP